MTLLDRYIGTTLAKSFLLVMLALLPLFSFLDLVQQLDDVGTGSYRFLDALLFELRMLPRRALDLLPFGTLVGSTIGLVLLARNSELIGMQAAGVSVARIAGGVLKSGFVLMLLAGVLEELAVSPIQQYAEQQRSLAMSESELQRHEEGFWFHQRGRFVNINNLLHGRIPTDIEIFEFGDERQLRLFIQAREADVSDPGHWLLKDLIVKRWEAGKLVTERLAEMYWESYLTAEEVHLLELSPYAMSPSQLYRYIQYLQGSGQEAERYQLAFWQKLTLPLVTGTMLLLSIPFSFGSLRSVSVGKRLTLAIASGVVFQIVNQVAANAGLVLQLTPALTTLAPAFLVLGIALVLTRRVR